MAFLNSHAQNESQMIMDLFQKREMGEKDEYRIFEALRDVKQSRGCYDTTHSQVQLFCLRYGYYNKNVGTLLAILCVYLITFSVNIFSSF